MKKIYNKYFELIGIKHEGLKRISFIIIVLFSFGGFIADSVGQKEGRIDFRDVVFYITIIPLWFTFLYGLIVRILVSIKRIIYWVIDGFKSKPDKK